MPDGAESGLAASAAAQSVSGTILGTVTDSTGATVAGAKVTLVNEGTGLHASSRRTETANTPRLVFPTGHYTITSEMTGFKTVALSNVELGVDQRVRINIKHEVGAMTESVSVTADTPLIQTSSSELGTTVGGTQIEALPLNGRNFVSLTARFPASFAAFLAPTSTAREASRGARRRPSSPTASGRATTTTCWTASTTTRRGSRPSSSSRASTRSTNSRCRPRRTRRVRPLARWRRQPADQVGTNRLHGSGFEFHRNDAFDANNFFNNRAGRGKPEFKQNQFGGTLGGAVFKDKTFFFTDYQGHRETLGQTFLSTVPTLAMREGNFSEVNRVIYDPTTGQPFPGNTIPSNRIDTVARNILTQLYPEPNTAGTRQANGQVINNYLINPIKEREDNQFDIKVDHNLSMNNRFFTRYSFQKTHRLQPASLPHGDAGATFGAGDGNIKGQSLAFNDTHTLGMNWLNEFRFGWSSIKFNMTPIDYLPIPPTRSACPGSI